MKIKTISLSLGVLASVAMPAVAVISCGSKTKAHTRPVIAPLNENGTNHGEKVENVNVAADYKEFNINANMAGNGLSTDYEKVSKDEEQTGKTFANFQDYRNESKTKITQLRDTLLNDQTQDPVAVATAIIRRYIGERVSDFTFTKIDKKVVDGELPIKHGSSVMENHEFNKYSFEVTADHQVHIEGSSAVAIARGWYDWMKRNGYGMIGWEANSIHLPAKSEFKVTAKTTIVSPYERHYYGNSAAAGYSTPWWNDHDWANWLAWCAVHGYDLMLDYVGHEQILTKLYMEAGYTKDNVRKYLSGPAYATWSRLGNIANWDSIPDNKTFDLWNEKKRLTQHSIKKMMNKMDIKGIPASFAGFVPEKQNGVTQSIEELFGATARSQTTQTEWTKEDAHHNHFLNPDWKPSTSDEKFAAYIKKLETAEASSGYNTSKSLFENLSKRYVELYQHEYGEFDLYLADAFEEMSPPAGVQKSVFFNKVGNALYRGIEAATQNNANGTAVFAFQGWNLGFQRGDWNPDNLEGFLHDIPDNKVFIIDQAEDYNEWSWHNNANFRYYKKDSFGGGQSFGGKKWTYCTIPNMGGNTAITGNLEWYGTAGPDALNEEKHGYLYAYGSAPEGIDNNPVTQELISDMGWRTEAIDIKNGTLEGYVGNNWLANYDINRYGFESKKLREYWLRRLSTANSYLDDHPVHKWQLRGWSTWTAPDSDGWLMALQSFKDVAKERQSFANTPLFRDDVFRMTNIYLGVILDRKLTQFQSAGTHDEWVKLKAECDSIFETMDRLTATHNTDRLSRWLEKAKWWGDEVKAPGSTNYFESDAKYHITLWYPTLEDYASKHWGGLIGYYRKKMDALMDRSIEGVSRESHAEAAVQLDDSWYLPGVTLPKVSLPWVHNPLTGTDLTPTAYDHPYAEAIATMEANSIIKEHGLTPTSYATLMSNPYKQHLKDIKTEFQVTTDQLRNLKSLTIFSQIISDWQAGGHNGNFGNPTIKDISIVAGTGVIWKHRNVGAALATGPGNADALTINLQGLPALVASNSNNGAQVIITWTSSVFTNAKLQLFMNEDIDPANEDKTINGAKTYTEFRNGDILRNEVQFTDDGVAQPLIELPQIVLPDDIRGSFINADGKVNKAKAKDAHVTIEPISVGNKDEHNYSRITYRVTADEGYELADTSIIRQLPGSTTQGTFFADKPFNGPAPTVEELSKSILDIFKDKYEQHQFRLKTDAVILTHQEQLDNEEKFVSQFVGFGAVLLKFIDVYDEDNSYYEMTLNPKEGDDTKWVLNIKLYTYFDLLIEGISIEMPKPSGEKETHLDKTDLTKLSSTMEHDVQIIQTALTDKLLIAHDAQIPSSGIHSWSENNPLDPNGDIAWALMNGMVPMLNSVNAEMQSKVKYSILPDPNMGNHYNLSVTLQDKDEDGNLIGKPVTRIFEIFREAELSQAMKHDFDSIEAALKKGVTITQGDRLPLSYASGTYGSNDADDNAWNTLAHALPSIDDIDGGTTCSTSYTIKVDPSNPSRHILVVRLQNLGQDGNVVADSPTITREFVITAPHA